MGDTPGVHRYVSFHERLKHINIDLARESGTTWGAASGLQVSGLDAPASVFAEATGAADVSTVAEAAIAPEMISACTSRLCARASISPARNCDR